MIETGSDTLQKITRRSLIHAGYKSVLKAFGDCTMHGERGGYFRGERLPFYKPGEIDGKIGMIKTYHVESTFDEVQYEYIAVVMAAMTALIGGKVLGKTEKQQEQLAQRIKRNFASGNVAGNFEASVGESILELLSDFQEQYPNLMPAANGLFTVAGTLGILEVLGEVRSNLHYFFIKEGGSMPYSIENSRFVRRHPVENVEAARYGILPSPDSAEYEVRCSGRAFAQAMIADIEKAALALRDDPAVRFSGETGEFNLEHYKSKLTFHMFYLSRKSLDAHKCGEL